MRFTKMQGIGNDYIFLNCTEEEPQNIDKLAVAISDRHFGAGSDGLICVCPSCKGAFRMRMFNADGSEGEMCGNGIRCLGKYVFDKGLTDKATLQIETLAGIRTLELHVEKGKVASVTVDMGIPIVEEPRNISVKGKGYTVYPVSMGNPHAVIFEPNISCLALTDCGPFFENHPSFPNRTNTEFVEVLSRKLLKMRVWERGSGETLACGTGACAVVAAAVKAGKADRAAAVQLLGGELFVTWDEKTGHVFMTGPATTVYEGEWPDHNNEKG